ncbi:hypothetical protein Emag_003052 [Eimeria magna]
MELATLKHKVIQELNQGHLFPPNANPEDEARLLEQLAAADAAYPGGLSAYVNRARQLLLDAKAGVNPFEGYNVCVPAGERLVPGTSAFLSAEEDGLREVGDCAFVLVAGGLGERLGYGGIKLSLPVESSTCTTYIEYYCKFIQALQAYARQQTKQHNVRLPLAIMTSGDTHAPTVAMLEKHNYFGLDREEVHFIQQQKVPALADMDARLATTPRDPFTLEMKPHGHGDVHSLLLSSGLLQRWQQRGIKWITLLQDTNAAIMRVLMAVIGVSARNDFAMNTIAVPRRPGEAVGSICRLVSAERELTLNVEYNVLDALLKAAGQGGDKAGPGGYSQLPGNTNAIVLRLEPYVKALSSTGGHVPEFINPKFKVTQHQQDASKTAFKSPARLESMMQDLPLQLRPEDKVGFVELPRWCCFSPVKNSLDDARKKAALGLPPESALSGEADFYYQNAQWMRVAVAAGDGSHSESGHVDIAEPEPVVFGGVQYQMGPRISLCPSWAISLNQMREKLQGASVKIARESVLLISGDVQIRNLSLDGALALKADPGASLVVENLQVQNKGWQFESVEDSDSVPAVSALRGFTIRRTELREIHVASGTETIRE